MSSNEIYVYLLIGSGILFFLILFKLFTSKTDEELKSWIDFGKFFLGTFVIGLLGFFAKSSYEFRQLAIMESDQIGKYVDKAMVDNIEARVRFAEYFSTVLPKNHTTGWTTYYKKLDSLNQARITEEYERDSLEKALSETPVEDTDTRERINEKLEIVNTKLGKKSDQIKAISTKETGAYISDPANDFVACSRVSNLRPININNRFPKGNVSVFAQIQAPQSENVKMKWYDYQGKLLFTQPFHITTNLGNGYRVYYTKYLRNAGLYRVDLVSGSGGVIGSTEFVVEETKE